MYLFTAHLTPLLLGADPKQILDAAIEPLAFQPCNVHLLVVLIDRLVVGLFPDLVGGGISAATTELNTNQPVVREDNPIATQTVSGGGRRTPTLSGSGTGVQGVEAEVERSQTSTPALAAAAAVWRPVAAGSS
jgi:hypothetical protein